MLYSTGYLYWVINYFVSLTLNFVNLITELLFVKVHILGHVFEVISVLLHSVVVARALLHSCYYLLLEFDWVALINFLKYAEYFRILGQFML